MRNWTKSWVTGIPHWACDWRRWWWVREEWCCPETENRCLITHQYKSMNWHTESDKVGTPWPELIIVYTTIISRKVLFQWWEASKNIYLSTILKYIFEVLVLYFLLFILLLCYIFEANVALFSRLHLCDNFGYTLLSILCAASQLKCWIFK